jgi:hypothetical protein
MRCLHVIDSFDAPASARALSRLLPAAADISLVPTTHDVLALSPGPLDGLVRPHARRVTVVSGGLEAPATILGGGYDLVHLLDRRPARMLATLLTSRASAVIAYSAPALDGGPGWSPVDAAERALVAACDLVLRAPTRIGKGSVDATLYRTVCMELARLTVAPDDHAGAGHDREGADLHFIAREWAAALQGACRGAAGVARHEVAHA